MLNNWKECKKLQWMSLLCNSSAMWNMSQTWVLLNLDNFIGNAAKNMISDQRRWSHRRFDHSHILILCFLGIPMTFYTLVYGVPDVVVPWQRWASVNHPGAGSIVFRCLHEWLGRIPRPWSLLPQEMWTDWWHTVAFSVFLNNRRIWFHLKESSESVSSDRLCSA